MYPWFMESIWWIFKQLYNKGLVYKGFKVITFICFSLDFDVFAQLLSFGTTGFRIANHASLVYFIIQFRTQSPIL